MATPSTLRPAAAWLVPLAAAALALALLTGCPKAEAPDPDPEAPTVTATVPADGTTDVAVTTTISVTFSANMNRATTEGALVSAPTIDCAFEWNDTDTTLTCTPDNPLTAATTYNVTITTEATDGDGVPLAEDHTFAFTTESDPDPDAPTVTATVPADGASNVAVTTIISVTFSLPMNPAATEGAITSAPAIDCTFDWNATDTTLTCTPDTSLTPDTTYTLSVGTDAESAAGTALGSAFDVTFTTAPEVVELCTFGTSSFGACRFGP